jgi:integrase
MGTTRTKGITLEDDGSRTVNKVWRGDRIFARLGTVSQDQAEEWLRNEITKRQSERDCAGSNEPVFASGAKKYLIECEGKPSAEVIAWHIQMLLPYLGLLKLSDICDDTLEDFKDDRLAGGMIVGNREPLKPACATTVNRSLEVVRTILNRAARAWRTKGKPWLNQAPPLISMLAENRRPPRPIDWSEQDILFPRLPGHLERMALFDVNTGARDENVCGLMWEWEVPVPEVGRSVFVIPGKFFKTKVPHVLILNDVAWSIVEGQRGGHEQYVFPYRGHRVETINNNGWQNARRDVGLEGVRVHDLRHTYSTRLRMAGVSQEDRNALMGHGGASMPEHYASADIGRLIEQANKASDRIGTRTLLRVVNGD